ncbi:MAG TPA: response regulator, partial [Coleofasciculaceae cyanobacterium]
MVWNSVSLIHPMQAGTDMKILLVEDDQATRAILENSLIAHHYNVATAVDGHSTLDLVEKFDYDLVLLDVGIPKLDGISVCKRLRTKGYQIPILLLTAKERSTDRIMGLDAGADDYMIKPVMMPELLARIRSLLRRSKTTLPSVVHWGNLQLDPAVNEIRYGEQLLRLTPKEYGILELLLLNPQRIFSRATLIDRLWELDEPPTESAISSHIKAIRQKLRAAGTTQDLIETVYGFGYRLRVLEPEGIPTPEQDARDADKLAMSELWERFKGSFSEQLDFLDRVMSALEDGKLTDDWRQEAKQTVHNLIGSLGVYGFPTGSALARQIESLLRSDRTLSSLEIQQMAEWVAALRQELNGEPSFGKPTSMKTAGSLSSVPFTQTLPQALPQVLILDNDERLIQQLQAEASSRSLQINVAASLGMAQQIIDRSLPHVVLLDLTFAERIEGCKGGLSWLATLKQQYPQLPVLVFTGQDSLSDRVAVARLGAQAFLQKPIASEQIFQTIQTLLKQVNTQD